MKLELYYYMSCPFCRRVMDVLEGRKHDIILKDIRTNPELEDELERRNCGNTQVPCLFIDGRPMLESRDIIEFLEKNVLTDPS